MQKLIFKKLGFHRTLYHAVATWVRIGKNGGTVALSSSPFQAPVRPARRRKTGESRSGAAKPVIISLNDRSDIPSDWSDLTDYINTLKAGRSCHSERWHAASTLVK